MTLFCLVSGFWFQGTLIWEWGRPYEVYAPPYLAKGDVPQPTGYFWEGSARVTNFIFLLICYESILVTLGAHMLKCIREAWPVGVHQQGANAWTMQQSQDIPGHGGQT